MLFSALSDQLDTPIMSISLKYEGIAFILVEATGIESLKEAQCSENWKMLY